MSQQYDMYQANWKDRPETNHWLRRMTVGETTLCFPQGEQTFGDLGADVTTEVNPDILADMTQPPFKPRSFDTVYCDPPYSMCAYDKIHGWLPEVWDLADKRLIVKMPAVDYNLKDSSYTLYFEHNGTATCHMPLFHVWDRQTTQLSSFEGNA